MWRCGGEILLFSPTVWAESGGGEEGHTQEHAQEHTRECCTYPLATYPLKSAQCLGCQEMRKAIQATEFRSAAPALNTLSDTRMIRERESLAGLLQRYSSNVYAIHLSNTYFLLLVAGEGGMHRPFATYISGRPIICMAHVSEKVFVSQERVSGFPEKGADLRGSPGNLRGSPGNFRGSLGNFRGTPGLLLGSTVRELPGKSPKNLRGSLGNFRGSPGTSQKLGGA